MSDIPIARRLTLALPSNATSKWRSLVIVRNEYKDKVLQIAAADVIDAILHARIKQSGSSNIGIAAFLQLAGVIYTSASIATPATPVTDDLLTASGGATRYNLLSQTGTGLDFNQSTPAFWGTNSITVGRATRDQIVSPPSLIQDAEIANPILLMPGEALELIAALLSASSAHVWFNGFFRAKATLTAI